MASRELFTKCSLTVSKNVPCQEKPLFQKVANLGFSLKNLEPLVIEKDSTSSRDLVALSEVLNSAFEPQEGDDYEIITEEDCQASSLGSVRGKSAPSSPDNETTRASLQSFIKDSPNDVWDAALDYQDDLNKLKKDLDLFSRSNSSSYEREESCGGKPFITEGTGGIKPNSQSKQLGAQTGLDLGRSSGVDETVSEHTGKTHGSRKEQVGGDTLSDLTSQLEGLKLAPKEGEFTFDAPKSFDGEKTSGSELTQTGDEQIKLEMRKIQAREDKNKIETSKTHSKGESKMGKKSSKNGGGSYKVDLKPPIIDEKKPINTAEMATTTTGRDKSECSEQKSGVEIGDLKSEVAGERSVVDPSKRSAARKQFSHEDERLNKDRDIECGERMQKSDDEGDTYFDCPNNPPSPGFADKVDIGNVIASTKSGTQQVSYHDETEDNFPVTTNPEGRGLNEVQTHLGSSDQKVGETSMLQGTQKQLGGENMDSELGQRKTSQKGNKGKEYESKSSRKGRQSQSPHGHDQSHLDPDITNRAKTLNIKSYAGPQSLPADSSCFKMSHKTSIRAARHSPISNARDEMCHTDSASAVHHSHIEKTNVGGTARPMSMNPSRRQEPHTSDTHPSADLLDMAPQLLLPILSDENMAASKMVEGSTEGHMDRTRGSTEDQRDRSRGSTEGQIDRSRGSIEGNMDKNRESMESQRDRSRGSIEGNMDKNRESMESQRDRSRGSTEGHMDKNRESMESQRDRSRGSTEGHMDKNRESSESQRDRTRGSTESHMDRPRGSTESHMDRPRGSTESHMDRPRGSTESHMDRPRGSTEGHVDRPRGSTESHMDRTRGSTESHMDRTRGSTESHMDRTRGSTEGHMDRTRGFTEGQRERSRGSTGDQTGTRLYPSLDGHSTGSTDIRQELSTGHVSGGNNREYIEIGHPRQVDRTITSTEGHMDRTRGPTEGQTYRTTGSTDSLMDRNRGSSEGLVDRTKESTESHMDRNNRSTEDHMDRTRGSTEGQTYRTTGSTDSLMYRNRGSTEGYTDRTREPTEGHSNRRHDDGLSKNHYNDRHPHHTQTVTEYAGVHRKDNIRAGISLPRNSAEKPSGRYGSSDSDSEDGQDTDSAVDSEDLKATSGHSRDDPRARGGLRTSHNVEMRDLSERNPRGPRDSGGECASFGYMSRSSAHANQFKEEKKRTGGLTESGLYPDTKCSWSGWTESFSGKTGSLPPTEEYGNKKIQISIDPQVDSTLLAHMFLLPKRMKCLTVKLYDHLNEGMILVEGEASEVFEIKKKFEDILATQTTSNENRDEQERHSFSSTASSRGSVNKQRSDERRTTYSDNFRNPSHIGRSDSEERERRKTGSSVDRQHLQSGDLITEHSMIKVRVKNADITTLKVDAIVNAANARLKHGGGVARAIADKAGQELQRECQNFITKGERKLNVTGTFVSTGGKLPAKHVIHAVGPKWSYYGDVKREECARDLRLTIFNCLLEANRLGCCSIAIPSISAAIFAVPIPICTRAYLEAIQTYDIYAKEQHNHVQEVVFVDVKDSIINSIQMRFSAQWRELPPSKQIHDDLSVITSHGKSSAPHSSRTDEASQYRGHSSSHSYEAGQSKPTPSSKSESTLSTMPLPLTHSNTSRTPQSSTGRPDVSRGGPYVIGRVRLSVSEESAFDLNPDLIVVVGDLFLKMHGKPAFDTRNIPSNEKLPQKKNAFAVHGGVPGIPFIIQLFIDKHDQENFDRAFQNLSDLTTHPVFAYTDSMVFTSTSLYASDQKLVGAFTRNVYEFLRSFIPSSGNFDAKICAKSEVLPAVQKVLDSRVSEARKLGGKGSGSRKDERSREKCGICLEENKSPHSLTCCDGSLCRECFKKVQNCPFCRKPFSRMRGDQPDGRMKVSFSAYTRLKGYEKDGAYTITYEFPSGRQGSNHPQPGQTYEKVTRIAYLPASNEGNKVLRLLRVAFLRRLTFTIGDSLTTGKKGVITWNDIHHKTSLKEGGAYGYPAPNYLQDVTRELADRGVTEESMSEREKSDLKKLYRDLSNNRIFLDF